MMALQALSIAETKAEGSGALSGVIGLSVAEAVADVLDVNTSPAGGTREDHFQPGVSAGSSRRERIRSLVCCSSGKRRRVIENPGMLKLVFATASFQSVEDHWRFPAYHECSGGNPLNRKAFGLELTHNFSRNASKLEFAESSEVVYQNDDSVLTSTTEGNIAPFLVFGRDYHRNELVDELIHRRDGGHPFVSCFVVNPHTDFNFVLGEVGFGCCGTGDLKIDSENREPESAGDSCLHGNAQDRLQRYRGSWQPFLLCYKLGRGMRLASPRHQRFCKQEPSQQDHWLLETRQHWGGELGSILPPSNNTSLSSADGNVVTNDKELDFLRLILVLSSELFLG